MLNVFIHYLVSDERLPMVLYDNQYVKDLIRYLEDYFKLGANVGGTERRCLILNYGGADLDPEWHICDINIMPGATIKCFIREEILPDYYVFIKFRKETYKYYDEKFDIATFTVYKLRVKLSETFGFPLSIFRLKSGSNVELHDDSRMIDYGIERHERVTLETWIGWESFLNNCIKGYTKQVLKTMNGDEIIKQYQARVALFISAHYGHFDLANKMMSLGARPEKPIGDHPSRQWCSPLSVGSLPVKPEYLRCPIHEAVLNGQLKLVSLFAKESWVLEEKDGFGIPPWRLSLRNSHKDPVKNANQKDVARYLLAKQFGAKAKIGNLMISNNYYYNLKKWIDNAKQKVLLKHGIEKSSFKKRPFHKGALLGYKVLVDGFNNNFKEYPNSYELLKPKYKYYYYIDDDDKNNHTNAEIYFKTLNTVGAFNNKAAPRIVRGREKNATPSQNTAFTKSNSTLQPADNRPVNAKARLLWRQIINKQISRNILLRNHEDLEALGYPIEFTADEMRRIREKSPDRQTKTSTQKNKSKKQDGMLQRVKNQISKEDENDKNKHMTMKQLKESKEKSKTLPKINEKGDLKRLKSISVNEMNKSRDDKEAKLRKMNASSMSLQTIPRYQSLDEPNYSINNKITNEGRVATSRSYRDRTSTAKSLEAQTMESYMKYCKGMTPRDTAKKCLLDANSFSNKSWLNQVQIGTNMVKKQVQRRFQFLVQQTV